MDEFKLKTGIVITEDEEEEEKNQRKNSKVFAALEMAS